MLGRRIAKRVYSSATGGAVAYTRFVYHGDQVAFETDSAGALGLRYTWGLGTDDLVGVRDVDVRPRRTRLAQLLPEALA